MKNCYSNSTVMWDAREIARRESLIHEIPILILSAWQKLNSAVRMERCETPVLVPADYLRRHIDAGFGLVGPCGTRGYLRPETTGGTYQAIADRWPIVDRLKKQLPFCFWQVGLSFRDEKNPETMRATKLRLVQFYQIEFQLFASFGSKTPYLEVALDALIKNFGGYVHCNPGEELPHYSAKALDWKMGDLEIGSCSERTDWLPGMVFEVSIELDGLVAVQLSEEGKLNGK